VDVINARPVHITTWMTGEAWTPDAFPASEAVHRRLGIFLAEMHSRPTNGFGSVDGDLRPPAENFDAAVRSAKATVDAGPWAADKAQLVESMARCDPRDVAASFAVIMPDVSASQFLYGDGDITAVVDIDSYVCGPVELELTVAEWCLSDHEAFAEGYESVRRLPRFADFRAFHRCTMLINEEALTGDLHRLLTENAVFP
jgi:Ser/Thr protein kinase RdoA (MazF antagonist)